MMGAATACCQLACSEQFTRGCPTQHPQCGLYLNPGQEVATAITDRAACLLLLCIAYSLRLVLRLLRLDLSQRLACCCLPPCLLMPALLMMQVMRSSCWQGGIYSAGYNPASR